MCSTGIIYSKKIISFVILEFFCEKKKIDNTILIMCKVYTAVIDLQKNAFPIFKSNEMASK